MSAIKQWSKLFSLWVANWRQFMAVHVVINVLVFVILAPLADVFDQPSMYQEQ